MFGLVLIFTFPEAVSAHKPVYALKYSAIISSTASKEATSSLSPAFVRAGSAKTEDQRLGKLRAYLVSKKSPLAPHSHQIIEVADKYGLDWRLLVAITGVESGFGKVMPPNSHNAYGWANGSTRFESWEKSIEHVSRVLGEKYIAQGLDTPEKIMKKYCPGSTTWANSVNMYMKHIDSFSSDS